MIYMCLMIEETENLVGVKQRLFDIMQKFRFRFKK